MTRPPASNTPPDSADGPDTPDRRTRLLALARGMPSTPGVYLMKDAGGVVVYVGKASNLPDRVGSYFVPSADLGPRKQPMLEVVETVECIPCEGEWEALLMEARLVKDLKPRFNARLLDDKTFPYLAVTIREEFPGVYITRDPAHERFRGARLYGPFTSGSSLRQAVQLLQRVFQYRTCELDIRSGDPALQSYRPCLLFKIDQCTAPCAGRVTPERYRQDIDRFCRFLEGRRSVMLRELQEEMASASAERRYEAAAVLRDQIRAIERLDERERRGFEGEYDWQPEVTISAQDPRAGCRSLQRELGLDREVRCVEAIDIAHLGGQETVGSLVCFVDGRPFKDRYRRYQVRQAANDDYAAIREVVSRRFREPPAEGELAPDVLLIDGGPGQLGAAMEALMDAAWKPPIVVGLSKREELLHLPGDPEPLRLSRNHRGLHLCQAIRDEAHRFARHYHHLLQRRRVIQPDPPGRVRGPGAADEPGGVG
jgi:excinuclease ABC subunit C